MSVIDANCHVQKEQRYVVILMGPCGGGKSTIAKELLEQLPNFEHIEIDKLKKEISGNIHESRQEVRNNWFREASRRTNNYIKNGKNVILDEAFPNQEYVDLALSYLDESNLKVIKVEIMYSLEVHTERYKNKPDSLEARTNAQIRAYYNEYKNGQKSRKFDLKICNPKLSITDVCTRILDLLQEKEYKEK